MAQPQRDSTVFTPLVPLTQLCAAVAFERLSFTGVVALFVLYLNERYALSPAHAALGLGSFVAATYLTPVAGGWLADRWRGRRHACILGTMLMALGGAALMLDRLAALFPALALIAAGQGLFKPNAQALVSDLYDQGDPRRAAAFRTYYVALNVGFMVGPVLADTLRRHVGWGFSFGVVVLGATLAMMAIGLPTGGPFGSERSATALAPALPLTRDTRRRIGSLCAVAMLFCAAAGQVAGSLLFWVRDSVDRRLFGEEIPTAYFAALPALLVIILAPLVTRIARSGRFLQRTRTKLTLGMLSVAVAYALLVIPASRTPMQGVSMLWIVAALALLCMGEILVMATGMDAVTGAVPAARTGLVYGLWCASAAAGNALAGVVGSLWGRLSAAEFFALLAAGSLGVTVGLAFSRSRRAVVRPDRSREIY